MNCEEARVEFSALLDGELTPGERARVEAHLGECAECLRELDGLKRVDGLYRALPAEGAPDGFEEGVRRALRPAVVRLARAGLERKRVWPLLAAAATFVVLVGGVLWQFGPVEERMQMASAPEAAAEYAPIEKGPSRQALGADEDLPPARDEVRSKGGAPGRAKKEAPKYDAPEGGRMGAAQGFARGEPAGRSGSDEALSDEVLESSNGSEAASVPSASAPRARVRTESLPSVAAPVDSEMGADVAQAQAPEPVAAGKDKEGYADRLEAAPAAVAAAPAEAADVDEDVYDVPVVSEDDGAEAEGEPGMEMAPLKRAAEPPSPPPPAAKVRGAAAGMEAKSESVSETVRRIGERVFELREGTWYQRGYHGEDVEELERGSAGIAEVLRDHPELEPVLELEGGVVFRLGDTWYLLAAAPNGS